MANLLTATEVTSSEQDDAVVALAVPETGNTSNPVPRRIDLTEVLTDAVRVLAAAGNFDATQQSSFRTAIGAAASTHTHTGLGAFDLHADVGTEAAALADDDRLVMSDESETGEPNRYVELSSLADFLVDADNVLAAIQALTGDNLTAAKTALEILGAFHLYSDVGSVLSSISGDDRLVVADVSRSDNANRYTTINALRSSILDPQHLTTTTDLENLDIFAIYSDDADASRGVTLESIVTFLNGALTIPSAFDLYADADTAISALAGGDRMVLADISTSGEPNRYSTLTTLASWILDLHNRIGTELTDIADDDRIAITDESESNDPTLWATADRFAGYAVNDSRVLAAIEALSGSDLTDAQEHLEIEDVDAANVLLAIKDFNDGQVSAAQFALSIVGGVSSFNENGTYTSNTLNTHHDGGAYIPPIDEVWIVDDNDNRVYRYETDSTSAGTLNVDSSNTTPKGVAYIESIDEVWIVENDQFHRYETDQTYIGALSTGFTNHSITGITYDTVRHRVIIVSDTANRLYTYGTDGTVTGNTSGNPLDSNNSEPSDVMYYAPLDEIWVLDRVDNTIYKYSGEDMSYIGTESLASGNTDSRMLVYISSIEEIWSGQNNSTTIYRYIMEVMIDRDKLVDAFENFSSSQRDDAKEHLGIPNFIPVMNSDVSYTNDHTIVIDGEDAEVNDVIIFQYRQNLTRTSDEVTIQYGSNTAGRVRILDSDLSLRWMTLNDITRYALYMVMRVDGDIWQYIGGTRNEVVPPFDLHEHVGTELATPATADRLILSDESASGEPNRYLELGDLSGFVLDIHERVTSEVQTVGDDDRFIRSAEAVSGDPTRYIEASDLRNYMLQFHGALTELTSLADTDRMMISDDSNANNLSRYLELGDLSSYVLDIHERIGTELTEIADDDRLAITDESESGEPVRWATADRVADYAVNADRVLDVLGNIDENQQEDAREGLDIFVYEGWEADNLAQPRDTGSTGGEIRNGKIVKVGGIYRATFDIDSLNQVYDEVYQLPNGVESPDENAIVIGSSHTVKTPNAIRDEDTDFTINLSDLIVSRCGIAHADGLIWVLAPTADPDIIRAINPTTHAEDTSRTITLSGNDNWGLTYGDGCLWVVDRSTHPDTFRAYTVATGNEDTSKSFQPSGSHGYRSITYDADEGIMWSNSSGTVTYAHRISDGAALTSRNVSSGSVIITSLTYGNGKLYLANTGQIRIYNTSDGSYQDRFFITRSSLNLETWIGYGDNGFWVTHLGENPDPYEFWQTENLEGFMGLDVPSDGTSGEKIQIIWEA